MIYDEETEDIQRRNKIRCEKVQSNITIQHEKGHKTTDYAAEET